MPQDPRKLALAQQVSHRIAMLQQTDAEICAATGIPDDILQRVKRSKLFRQVHENTLNRITDKMAEKSIALQCGSMEEMVKIRRANAWDAYLRIVEIAKEADSEKIRFDANKWLAAAGGISEVQETMPSLRHDVVEMDDKTKEFVVATIRAAERVTQRSVQVELPEKKRDAIDITN